MTFWKILSMVVRTFCYGLAIMVWTTLMFSLINQRDTLAVAFGVFGLCLLGVTLACLVRWEIRRFQRLLRVMPVLAIALLAGGCTKTVPPGYVGVEVDYYGGNRGVKDIPIVSGVVWYNPWTKDILLYPTFVQSAVWTQSKDEGKAVNEEITFSNKDQMRISVDVSLSYHLEQGCVPAFYVKFRSDALDAFTHGFMRNVARDSFDKVGGKYAMDQIMGDNAKFLEDVEKRFQEKVKPLCVGIDQFGIIGVPRPPPAVIESINAKATATQNAIRTENELRQATAEAQKNIARANGDATANVLRAEGEAKANAALANSLTPTVIEWQRLQIQQHQTAKWNGVLPTVSTNAPPMLMMNTPRP